MSARKIASAGCLLLLLGLGIGTPAVAQDRGDAKRLEQLLVELRSMTPKAWKARLGQLEADLAAARKRASDLRKEAARLETEAGEADAGAKVVQAEMARLRELQKLVAALPAKPPAAKNAAAKKEPAKKQPAKKPAAKPPPKAAPAAKPPPKAAPPAAKPKGTPAPQLVTYDDHVEDLMMEHCSVCHDPDDSSGGLDVTSFAALRQGGGSGKTVVAGQPGQSRLYQLVAHKERPFMPEDSDPLPAQQVELIRLWIEQGAAEDVAGARAYQKKQAAKAKAAAAAAAPGPAGARAPMPEGLPAVELRVAGRAPPVKCVARSPAAPLLALPGLRQVLLLDAGLEILGVLPCPLQEIETLAFSPDGAWLLAGGGTPGKRGRAVLFDVVTGAQLGEFGVERDSVLAAAVHHGKGLVALGGPGKLLRVYAAADGAEQYANKGHDDWILSLAFSADGALLASADRAGAVLVWEAESGRDVNGLKGHAGAVHGLAFHGSGALASVGADGTLRTWDVREGKERWRKGAHRGEALALSAGVKLFVTGGSDGRIRAWGLDGRTLATSPDLGDWVYAVADVGDGAALLGGDWHGRLHRFETKAKKVTAVLSLLQPGT